MIDVHVVTRNKIGRGLKIMIKTYKKKYKTHDETIEELERKKRIAEMKYAERKLKGEILKLYFPFQFKPKFNKVIVSLSIVAIITYTIAAILLQKYIMTEPSPTLTTCVYAFWGTELLGLAGIKIYDTKYTYTQCEAGNISENITENDPDVVG